jgi:hypothetical protein
VVIPAAASKPGHQREIADEVPGMLGSETFPEGGSGRFSDRGDPIVDPEEQVRNLEAVAFLREPKYCRLPDIAAVVQARETPATGWRTGPNGDSSRT